MFNIEKDNTSSINFLTQNIFILGKHFLLEIYAIDAMQSMMRILRYFFRIVYV
jgi:hypothetical protein